MPINLSKIDFKYRKVEQIEDLKKLPALEPFDENVCEFLGSLSAKILKDSEARKFSDIVTFAFFIRKANLEMLKKEYKTTARLGRGLSFHVAPSNVPVNFAYTFAAGLLAGNSCIVRASFKGFEQTEIICRIMNETACENDNPVSRYIVILTYERNKDITDYFSSMCDVRVVWGGNQTVYDIRQSVLPARSVELTFADRYSLGIINADYVLHMEDMKKTAQDFYNDTYLYDQNACSSPRLIYWLGQKEEVCKAQDKFWKAVYDYVSPKYRIEPIAAVDKLTMEYRAALELENISIPCQKDNLIHRICVHDLSQAVMDFVCPGGSFFEYASETIEELTVLNNKKIQTLSYLGFNAEELSKLVIQNGLSGIDRIVPIGKTSDFTLTWDGYNLIEEMSRQVYWE